jgi:hypothetical protein
MWWHNHPALLFLIVPANAEHAGVLLRRATDMVATPWGTFFKPPIPG